VKDNITTAAAVILILVTMAVAGEQDYQDACKADPTCTLESE
jgi:hypothetical protein